MPRRSSCSLRALAGAVLGGAPRPHWRSWARTYARGLAIVYGLPAVMGLIDAANLNLAFGLVPIVGADVWLHAVTAIAAAYFGWGPVPARSEAASA